MMLLQWAVLALALLISTSVFGLLGVAKAAYGHGTQWVLAVVAGITVLVTFLGGALMLVMLFHDAGLRGGVLPDVIAWVVMAFVGVIGFRLGLRAR